MTKTWEDYKGPNLTKPFEGFVFSGRSGCCEVCKQEVDARMRWADEQNRFEALAEVKLAKLNAGEFAGEYADLPDTGTVVRQFSTGANRDTDTGKLDYEGFLSPLALEAFATYMTFNRTLADGSTRASDNWQKGIPIEVYAKSAWRHFFSAWSIRRGWGAKETLVWALCGVLFNIQGWLHELLKEDPSSLTVALKKETDDRAKRWAAASPSTPKP